MRNDSGLGMCDMVWRKRRKGRKRMSKRPTPRQSHLITLQDQEAIAQLTTFCIALLHPRHRELEMTTDRIWMSPIREMSDGELHLRKLVVFSDREIRMMVMSLSSLHKHDGGSKLLRGVSWTWSRSITISCLVMACRQTKHALGILHDRCWTSWIVDMRSGLRCTWTRRKTALVATSTRPAALRKPTHLLGSRKCQPSSELIPDGRWI